MPSPPNSRVSHSKSPLSKCYCLLFLLDAKKNQTELELTSIDWESLNRKLAFSSPSKCPNYLPNLYSVLFWTFQVHACTNTILRPFYVKWSQFNFLFAFHFQSQLIAFRLVLLTAFLVSQSDSQRFLIKKWLTSPSSSHDDSKKSKLVQKCVCNRQTEQMSNDGTRRCKMLNFFFLWIMIFQISAPAFCPLFSQKALCVFA